MKREAFDGVKQMIDRRKMFALLGAAAAAALFPSVGNAAPQQGKPTAKHNQDWRTKPQEKQPPATVFATVHFRGEARTR
jgi:hypothetical protein